MLSYYNEHGSYIKAPAPDQKQVALYRIARNTTDPKRLASLMPAYLKKHIADRTIKPLPEFVPGKPPKLPMYTTPRLGIERKFPIFSQNPELYIKQFDELNHYKGEDKDEQRDTAY